MTKMRIDYGVLNRERWERETIGILCNFPQLVDKINFDERYFMIEVYRKAYRYLKEVKVMDYEKMLNYMTTDEADDVVNNVYTQCLYTTSNEDMLLGYAKMILESYKRDEIDKLDEQRAFGYITSDEYYVKLTEIKELTCEPKVELLTSGMIDDVVCEDENGIKIDRFELLSNNLKIQPTDVVTVAAESGFGKSALLLNFYRSLSQDALNQFKCQYYNIEVNPKQIIKRLLAITSDRRVNEFTKENINMKFYIEAKQKLLNDSFVESGSITIEEMKAKILSNLDQEKINVAFVDHIGLVDVKDRYYNKSEYDRVTYCMKELRKLALDYNLIIFIACQFDRSSVKDNKIGMHSLKSSGEIENSSTHVLLLKESNVKKSADKKLYEEVSIDVAKNRNGSIGELDFYTFKKTMQVFVERNR